MNEFFREYWEKKKKKRDGRIFFLRWRVDFWKKKLYFKFHFCFLSSCRIRLNNFSLSSVQAPASVIEANFFIFVMGK